jgi:hypothetical protein
MMITAGDTIVASQLVRLMEQILNHREKSLTEAVDCEEIRKVMPSQPSNPFLLEIYREFLSLLDEDAIHWSDPTERIVLRVNLELLKHMDLPLDDLKGCRAAVVRELRKCDFDPSQEDVATRVSKCLATQ